jgi:serine/threonine-protein kinase
VLTLYALARARLWFFGGEGSGELALEAANRALKAAPYRGEPHLALAVVRYQNGDLSGAVRCLRRALVLAPSLADAHELLGRILVETGPLPEALRHLRLVMELDPALFRAVLDLARMAALRGDQQQFQDLMNRIDNDPQAQGASRRATWVLKARLSLWRQDKALAQRILDTPGLKEGLPVACLICERAVGLKSHRDTEAALGHWLGQTGSGRGHVFYYQIMVESRCYDNLEPWTELTACVNAGLVDVVWLDLCPLLTEIRKDPRILPLRAQVEARAQKVREALQARLEGGLTIGA